MAEIQKLIKIRKASATILTDGEIEQMREEAVPWREDFWGDPNDVETPGSHFRVTCMTLFRAIDIDGDRNLTIGEAMLYIFSHIKDVEVLSDICFKNYDKGEDGEPGNGELDQNEFERIIWELCESFSHGPLASRKKDSKKRADTLFKKFSEVTRDPKKLADVRTKDDRAINKDGFTKLLDKERWIINFFIHMMREKAKRSMCQMCGYEWAFWPSVCVPECARKRGEEEGNAVGGLCAIM